MSEPTAFHWKTLRAIALTLLVVRICLLFVARPFMDETYYWMWGQHLDLSYFDHPALIGWTHWLAAQLGWNIVAMRLPVLVTLLVDIGLLQLMTALDRDGTWRARFWVAVSVFLVTPIFVITTGTALPDHLLVCFALLTVYAVRRIDRSELGSARWLYLAGFAIGLATLSKYTGALLGVALVVHLLLHHRRLFRSPHLYAALALAVALQAPVIAWNVAHGFASLGFIVGGRRGLGAAYNLSALAGYLAGAIAVLSPFLIPPLVRLFREPGAGRYGITLFVVSSLLFLLASFFTNILIHWNILAYVGIVAFLAPLIRRRWLFVSILTYGGIGLTFATVNYGVMPVSSWFGEVDQTSAWSYGWDEVAGELRRIEATEHVGFVAATDYTLAAPLGFALHDPAVTSLSPRTEAYDFWFDAAAHRGESALIVADRWRGLPAAVETEFQSIEKVSTLRLSRFGRRVNVITIYLGRGYQASSQAK